VKNDGIRLGTVYLRFLVADAYALDVPAFDSDRDLSANEKQALRLIDIPAGQFRSAVCAFRLPAGSCRRPFDVRLQVWNPHRLFHGSRPYLFHDTGWRGGFEVVAAPPSPSDLSVFLSYSWSPPSHKAWVALLAEELRKYDIDCVFDRNDLHPGDQVTHFMERGMTECSVTLIICSEDYTLKANARESGVGYETNLSANEYLHRSPEERMRFIPIVRDNNLPKRHKLPKFLGSSKYIDMSSPDWQGEPMRTLVDAIRRHARPT
jgi:hypothetical protein